MARDLGPGENYGTVRLGWNCEDGIYIIRFGDHTARLFWQESYGVWKLEIKQATKVCVNEINAHMEDILVFEVTLIKRPNDEISYIILDDATSELVSWMLTEVLG